MHISFSFKIDYKKSKHTDYRNRLFILCDGQILVTDDMLGISGFYPKFVKKYASLDRIIEKAVKKYTREVKTKRFPTVKNFLNG